MSPITVASNLWIVPELLGIFDPERQSCIVLNVPKGRYLELSGLSLELICCIYKLQPCSIDYISDEIDASLDAILEAAVSLYQHELISDYQRGLSTSNHKNSKHANFTMPRQPKVHVVTALKNYPTYGLIIEYALLIPWWKLQVQTLGWRPVKKILLQQGFDSLVSQSPSLEPLHIVEEIISAIRCACVFPWVTRSCIPNSLAIFFMLKKRGYLPRLLVGADIVPFEPHMWVELDGYRIDSGADEQALLRFKPLSSVIEQIFTDEPW